MYSALCHAVCTVLGFGCPVWNELFIPKLYLYVGKDGRWEEGKHPNDP